MNTLFSHGSTARIVLVPTLLSIVFVIGCGDNSLKVYPVSGTVTYKSKPLDNATINFIIAGKEGQPTTIMGIGTTDANGKYTIKTHVDPTEMPLDGAVEGSHQVTIHKYMPPKGMTEEDLAKSMARETKMMQEQGFVPPEFITPSRVPFLPPKYQNPQMSQLSAKVEKGGQNVFDFTLD
ncbi:MAG: hypothetical protein ABL921_29445 [Pirellula sp.]